MPAKRTTQKRVKAQRKAKPKNVVRAKTKARAKPRNVVKVKPGRPAPPKRKPRRGPARNVVVEAFAPAVVPAPAPPAANELEVSGVWGVVRLDPGDPDAETKEIFGHYDRDGSGQIDAKEFARLCEALGMELEEHELTVAILDVDRDRDGRIGRDEFLRWWRSMRG